MRRFFAALLLLSSAAAAEPADREGAAFLSKSCHAGLSIAVVTADGTVFHNYGTVSRATPHAPTKDSVYEIASVTKSFTGALAAQAVADGKMALDRDFRSYLPQAYPNLARDGVSITLRSLATHRSGLPRDLPDSDAIFARRDYKTLPFELIAQERGWARDRYLTALHGVALASTPGTAEAYSNLAMKVLGFGLETVRKQPFEALMQSAILTPLAMRDTGFAVTQGQRRRLVTGYDRFGTAMPYHLRNAGAAWGLYSTPADMARYVRWQLDESQPAIRLAHRPLIEGQGLIWNLATANGERMLWHGGGSFGMTSQVVLYPDAREGYALLANDSCDGTESALKAIAERLHGSEK